MSTRKATIGILVSIILALIAWDIWVVIEPTPGDTISEITMFYARRHPVIPFALGVVCGHLLWGQRLPPGSEI